MNCAPVPDSSRLHSSSITGKVRGRKRLIVLTLSTLAAALYPATSHSHSVIRVPQDFDSVQLAINSARPGDVVLIGPGIYRGEIEILPEQRGITVSGTNRNAVVFDGGNRDLHGFYVTADDVTLQNFTARAYRGNAFYWNDVDGFEAKFLTAYNVGEYGIYAEGGQRGKIGTSYVSGAGRAGFYIGECKPCDVTVSRVESRLSEVGFSATNTGSGLVVRNSIFEKNGSGVILGSFDEEPLPPLSSARIVQNLIVGSGTAPTPSNGPLGGFQGIGIGLLGANNSVIQNNDITNSSTYGIAVVASVRADAGRWIAKANSIQGNLVKSSGAADLGISSDAAPSNCFRNNNSETSLPTRIQQRFRCNEGRGLPKRGSPRITRQVSISLDEARGRRNPDRPLPQEMPTPAEQKDITTASQQGGWLQALTGHRHGQRPDNRSILAPAMLILIAGLAIYLYLQRRQTR
jgi:hypothetical protein